MIDTPNVRTFYANFCLLENYINYIHPLSVLHLTLPVFHEQHSIFKNIETLRILQTIFTEKTDNLLMIFKKLKEIKFVEKWKYANQKLEQHPCQKLQRQRLLNFNKNKKYNLMRQILEQKRIFGKDHLKISFDGFEILNANDVDSCITL